MRSKIHERDQDCKETQDVQYQDQAFEMRECLASDGVDDDCKGKNSPAQQHGLIRLWRVTFIAHENGALQDSSSKVCGRSGRGLPTDECHPSGDVAQKSSIRRWG
jgi:hypothetical protein